jgi:hypothetical protein
MCDKCVELDGKIKHYGTIASKMTDQITLDRIKVLIAKLESQKVALHPFSAEASLIEGPRR